MCKSVDAARPLGVWRRDAPRHLLDSPGYRLTIAQLSKTGMPISRRASCCPEPRVLVHPGAADAGRFSRRATGSGSIGRTGAAPSRSMSSAALRLCGRPLRRHAGRARSCLWSDGGGKPAWMSHWTCTCSATTSTDLDWILMVYAAIVGVSYARRVLPRVAGTQAQGSATRDAAVEARLKTLRRSSIRTSCSTRCTRSRRWCTAIRRPPIG